MAAGPRAALSGGRPAAWVVLAALALALLAGHVLFRAPLVSGDSAALVQGTHAIVACLEDDVWQRCNEHLGGREAGVPQFPPLQYLPALVFTQLGLGDADVLKGLAILNVAGLLVLVALLAHVGRGTGRPWAAPLLVLMVLASPLLLYAWYTFGELLAAALLTAPVAAALLRARPAALGLLVLLAGWTKETSVAWVVPACALALWATPLPAPALRRAHGLALAAGAGLGVLTHALLNQFRYGTFTNEVYTDPVYQVPGVGVPARFFLSLWGAPNGGLAWFWPVATALVAIPVVILVVRGVRRPRDWPAWLPAAVVTGLLLVNITLLAKWAAPFGWIAWGPRLALSLMPLLALLAVVLHLDATERALRWLGARAVRRAAAVAILLALLVPQVGVLFQPDTIDRFFTPDPANERCPRVPSIAEGGFYYGCIIDLAWRRPSVLADASGGVAKDLGPLYLFVFAAASGALALAAMPRPAHGRQPKEHA